MNARLALLPILLACLAAGPVHAACTNPTGKEADQFYNGDYHTYQFCNGTSWIQYRSGASSRPQRANNPTYPAGSGFFVLTGTSYTGNLGGLSGANTACLTELSTTHTGWKGYSTAHSNGQLVAGKVFAFLGYTGDGVGNNLNPSTTYYFANAGDVSAGGASFTTDGSGQGPQDNADWAAANYFSGTFIYRTSRDTSSAALWGTGGDHNFSGDCNTWANSTNSYNSSLATTADTGTSRWNLYIDTASCDKTYPIICFVNP